jgi:hypothetical protein
MIINLPNNYCRNNVFVNINMVFSLSLMESVCPPPPGGERRVQDFGGET